jgi:hypothetical protein
MDEARPVGRVMSVPQFWALMERWAVSDETALALIAFPGKIGKTGKRPRFRFITRQQRMTSYLLEIDQALETAGMDAAWLHRPIAAAPFSRHSPLAHMIAHGMEGMQDVLRALNRNVMRAALRAR